jgi:5-methylcytosine-specific restriction endonuclease McrA
MKRTRLRRVSKVRASQLRTYSRLRLAFLRQHVNCWICGKVATEVHHVHGREGKKLYDFSHCLALCFQCHRKVHDNPKWARGEGYLV